KRAKTIEERHLVVRIDLNGRRSRRRIVESADRNLYRTAVVICQRRSAGRAKSAANLVRAGKMRRRAARPCQFVRRDQRTEKATERLLAHAAMADRGVAETPRGEPHRAALASA